MRSMDSAFRGRVLIVDQAGYWPPLLMSSLTRAGFDVDTAADGPSALRKARALRYTLILLDLMHGGRDGVRICKEIRATRTVPIIVVTVCRDEETMLAAFAAGADDYLIAPFDFRELLARMRTILSRIAAARHDSRQYIPIGDLVIDRERYTLILGARSIALRAKECALLLALAQRQGAVVSRAELLQAIWGDASDINPRRVDVIIPQLRRRLAATALRIETVWGIGYRLAG